LHETPLEWLGLVLRIILAKFHDKIPRVIGHPADLEFLPFWLNFGYVVPAFKCSPKLVELVSVHEFCMIMALKV
jgi:hypothetical protein